MTKEAVMV